MINAQSLPPCIARELAREPAAIRDAFERYLEGAAWIVIDRARAPMLRQHWCRFKKRCNAAGRRDGIAPVRWKGPPLPEWPAVVEPDVEPPSSEPDDYASVRGELGVSPHRPSESRTWVGSGRAGVFRAPYEHTAAQDRKHRALIAKARGCSPDEVVLRRPYSVEDIPEQWRGRPSLEGAGPRGRR